MKKNISVESISDMIDCQFPGIEPTYKRQWYSASTDLQCDLGMSWCEIVELLLKIEEEIGIEIIALPVHHTPSLKIGYLVHLFTYAESFDPEEYKAELLKYACSSVPIYKTAFQDDVEAILFHGIGTEFDYIASDFYSQYQYGNLIYNKDVELSGKFKFSMYTAAECIFSELPLWRKRKKWYGIAPRDKYVCFETANIIGNRLASPTTMPFIKEKGLCLSIPENTLPRIEENGLLTDLNAFAPKWIKGTCCSIYSLCLAMRRSGMRIQGVCYIELESDNPVSADIIKYISETFTTARVTVTISNIHAGPIFITCPDGHYHCIVPKAAINVADDKNQDEFPYFDFRMTSGFRIASPIIDIDTFLYVNANDETVCRYRSDEEIMDILVACGFDGFANRDGQFISVATIKMCIGLVNSEYNNPIAAMQATQAKTGTVRLYLQLKNAFNKWEKKLAESVTSYLKIWGTSEMEWELVFVDELFPFEYTSAKIYYQNRYE